jgi:hypothetical protein
VDPSNAKSRKDCLRASTLTDPDVNPLATSSNRRNIDILVKRRIPGRDVSLWFHLSRQYFEVRT